MIGFAFLKKHSRLSVFAATLILLIGIYFVSRNIILRYYINGFTEKFSEKHGAQLEIDNFSFDGLSSVHFSGIAMIPSNGDTLLTLQTVSAKLKILSLFLFKPAISDFELSGLRVTATKNAEGDNFSFLWKRDTVQKVETHIEGGYHETASKILGLFFRYFPDHIAAKDLSIMYSDGHSVMHFEIPLLLSEESRVRGNFTSADSLGNKHLFQLEGSMLKSEKVMEMKLISDSKDASLTSYLESKYKLKIAFDSLEFRLKLNEKTQDQFSVSGNMSAWAFKIKQPRISNEVVWIRNQSLDFNMLFSKNAIELDSSSRIRMNKIEMEPFIRYSNSPDRYVVTDLRFHSIPANDFFNSLPYGLFYISNTVRGEGALSYAMHFEANLNKTDTVIFSSELKKENLKLDRASLGPITRINQLFDHTVYEKGEPVRSFLVGPENPNFVPLNRISELLKNCVLTAEDGAFFWHRGFNEEMFAKAIADNIRKKKFARGASTITMQLVKNVYLSRTKTISRKLEEAMIVWLIENNRLVSKERMFEVYLNIIEWGPGIYGVGPASEFYFKKKPAELRLEECIFLASIVPRPKAFRYSFDKEGNLNGSLKGYYKLISGILLKREVISQAEYDRLKPNISLTGAAKKWVLPPDSLNEEETNPFELLNFNP